MKFELELARYVRVRKKRRSEIQSKALNNGAEQVGGQVSDPVGL